MTLVRGAVQGTIKSWGDALRSLGWGAVSGAGFYGGKEVVGSGRLTIGWVVANVSASVSENTAAGLHPLAQIGYSIGPVRVRVPIPRWQEDADAHVYLDASGYQMAMLIGARLLHERMRLKGGLLAFERDTRYEDDEGGDVSAIGGVTVGVFPGVWAGPRDAGFSAAAEDWPHEFIHAIQSLQLDTVEPRIGIFFNDRPPVPVSRKRLVRFEQFKIGLVDATEGAFEAILFPYHRHWREIEAYRLADERPPPRIDDR